MDAIGRYVADAVLGTDTLWGGDVMCPSGTGRFIADSWFSDEQASSAQTTEFAVRVSSPDTPREHAQGGGEISIQANNAPQLRHGARLQHGRHDCERRDADRKTGDPRHLLRKRRRSCLPA